MSYTNTHVNKIDEFLSKYIFGDIENFLKLNHIETDYKTNLIFEMEFKDGKKIVIEFKIQPLPQIFINSTTGPPINIDVMKRISNGLQDRFVKKTIYDELNS